MLRSNLLHYRTRTTKGQAAVSPPCDTDGSTGKEWRDDIEAPRDGDGSQRALGQSSSETKKISQLQRLSSNTITKGRREAATALQKRILIACTLLGVCFFLVLPQFPKDVTPDENLVLQNDVYKVMTSHAQAEVEKVHAAVTAGKDGDIRVPKEDTKEALENAEKDGGFGNNGELTLQQKDGEIASLKVEIASQKDEIVSPTSADGASSTAEAGNTEQKWNDGWRAMGYVPRSTRWGRQHTEVLKSIELPRWSDASSKDIASDSDKLGDAWLPPRLHMADEIRTLEYGVLFCATGAISYAEKQVVPMIRHLIDNLGILPDAKERASLRKRGTYSGGSKQGFALVTTREFVDGPLKDFVAFFDAVYLDEDLPAYPFDWQKKTRSGSMIKATKVHVMASAPFDKTIMLDFDSFPCHSDFALPLLEAFGSADIGFTNIVDEMASVRDSRHFLGEHNSALVVMNMKSTRTRVLMALYIQAFHRAGDMNMLKKKTGQQRDQPSLMIAMQAMAEEFQQPHGPETPNESVRNIIDRHKLSFIQHVDFDSSLVCRHKTMGVKNAMCSPDSSCVIAHKDRELYVPKSMWNAEEGDNKEGELIKVFGLGFKKTATTSLDEMFSHLIDTWGGSRPQRQGNAVDELIKGVSDAKSLALAKEHHYFQDAPWCQEPQRLYRKLAYLYPTAKFILTVRDPDQWYQSVTNWVQCRPKEKGRCGDKKMERYRAIFGANSTSREDFISAFVSHNDAIREFFFEELKQPHRLFEINLTDKKYNGWALFCDFVGLSEEQCPKGDVPHKNETPASPALGEEE